MAVRTKAMMASELDALRHEVSQLRADKARLDAALHQVRTDLNVATRHRCGGFSSQRDAMTAAREEALRTGRSVVVPR